jgi:hypothetical protein
MEEFLLVRPTLLVVVLAFDVLSNRTRNASTPITYTLSFTNTTAFLSLNTSQLNPGTQNPLSNMTLTFSGSRNNTLTLPSAYRAEHHQYNIQLNTSDPSMPHFSYLDGTQIAFTNRSDG